jgi:hypothetical protein
MHLKTIEKITNSPKIRKKNKIKIIRQKCDCCSRGLAGVPFSTRRGLITSTRVPSHIVNKSELSVLAHCRLSAGPAPVVVESPVCGSVVVGGLKRTQITSPPVGQYVKQVFGHMLVHMDYANSTSTHTTVYTTSVCSFIHSQRMFTPIMHVLFALFVQIILMCTLEVDVAHVAVYRVIGVGGLCRRVDRWCTRGVRADTCARMICICEINSCFVNLNCD